MVYSPARSRAIALLLLAVLFWSSAGVLINRTPLSAWAFCGAVSGIGMVVQFCFVRSRPKRLSANTVKALIFYSAIGVLSVAATQLTTAALILTTPEAILNPIFVALFVGEIPGPRAMLGAVVVLTTITWYSAQLIRAARLPPLEG